MTLETSQRQETTVPRSWARIAERLSAVVRTTSNLSYWYPSLAFEPPVVSTRGVILNRQVIRWSAGDDTEIWLRSDGQDHTVGIRSGCLDAVGALTFWAIVDPSNRNKSISGFVVMRRKGLHAVAKLIHRDIGELNETAVCVVAPAKLIAEADNRLLSSLAKGFSDAASDQDRDAWSSWLWRQVTLGRVKASYSRTLGSKIFGRRARRPERINRRYSGDALTVLANIGVFERDADYVLPSGLHAAVHVNLGLACGHAQVLRLLAEHVNEKLADIKYNTIVSTGWPVAAIARRAIRLRPMTAAGVVRHCDYEGVPPIPLTPVARGNEVVVITDVRITGGLIAQVVKSIEAVGATVKAVLAVVDGAVQPQPLERLFRSICRYDVQAVSSEWCPRCGVLERREFNPVACCMTRRKETPRSPGEFLHQNAEAAEFWRHVDTARAYEHHRVEGNTHYLAFIDTERLLSHEAIGPSLVTRLVSQLAVTTGLPDVILVPARARARLLADKLLRCFATGDRLWPPDIVSARQIDGRFRVSSDDSALMRGAKVLIADTGVTHGATLDDLQEVAITAEARTVGAVAIISRMSDAQEAALSRRFDGKFVRVYQVPIRPLSIPDSLRRSCPVCRRRDDIVRAAAESKSQPIIELSATIRARSARRNHGFVKASPTMRAQQMRLMAQDDVPFLTHCRRGTASGVTLHSLHAAMNDGMAPLKVPEICDDDIPATSRTAILEHLDKSALQWSGDSLLYDALWLLNNRDLDDIWGACAGLLNRASQVSWIDALERRLLSSSSARSQQSMAVWNRIAFEVFSLLKHEPSYHTELSNRFQRLRLSCANTPAEQGLARVLDVINKADRGSDAR